MVLIPAHTSGRHRANPRSILLLADHALVELAGSVAGHLGIIVPLHALSMEKVWLTCALTKDYNTDLGLLVGCQVSTLELGLNEVFLFVRHFYEIGRSEGIREELAHADRALVQPLILSLSYLSLLLDQLSEHITCIDDHVASSCVLLLLRAAVSSIRFQLCHGQNVHFELKRHD